MWLIILCVFMVALLYNKIASSLKYWKKKGISYIKPWPYFGNMLPTIFRKQAFPCFLQDLYNTHPERRYVGIYEFSTPILMFRDLELIKQISIKDFDTFSDRQSFLPEDVDPFWNRNLLALSGEKWRTMRATLIPAFTSSKMRSMFGLIKESAKQFTDNFVRAGGAEAIEMKDIFTRFTNDVTASTIFGVTCDSLKNGDNEFYLTVKQASNWGGIKRLKLYGYAFSPWLMRFLKVSFFEEKVKNFFQEIVTRTIKLREEQNIIRPDMMHLLMEAKKGRLSYEDFHINEVLSNSPIETNLEHSKRSQQVKITDEDITAQALIFLLGGFDTSSTLISFLSYELAINYNIQTKLINEIDNILKIDNGEVSYEVLLGMNYMDMVVTETLRKWPPSILASRVTNKPFFVEPKSANEIPLHLATGTICWIPIYAIHRDPKYYPDPDRFDPERFSNENKRNMKQIAFLPFGMGPRNCIGSRFALLKAKTIVFYLLSQFEIIAVEKTEIPLTLSKIGTNLSSSNGFWLGLKPRNVINKCY